MTAPAPTVAPDGTACPTCGFDVGGFTLRTTADGVQAWDRPTKFATGPTGNAIALDGLTHVEGGRRCSPPEVPTA